MSLRVACARQPRPMPHQFAAMLDHPARLRYRDPVGTLGLLGITAGMTVLDLGCGTGTFTVDMAHMVGDDGTIHAVDIQRSLLEQAQTRVAAAGVAERVQFHHSGAYQLPLPDASCDLALVVATLSQIPDPLAALWELQRVLKPGARLVVSEELPDPAYVSPRVTRARLEEAGLTFRAKSGNFFCYTMLFTND